MGKLIGYARVSTRAQDADRQITDMLGAGVRRDDLYTDQGVSGARASRPGFDKALEALQEGDTLVITTLDRLGRSTANMLDLAKDFRERGIGLWVLNLTAEKYGRSQVKSHLKSLSGLIIFVSDDVGTDRLNETEAVRGVPFILTVPFASRGNVDPGLVDD